MSAGVPVFIGDPRGGGWLGAFLDRLLHALRPDVEEAIVACPPDSLFELAERVRRTLDAVAKLMGDRAPLAFGACTRARRRRPLASGSAAFGRQWDARDADAAPA